MKRGYYNDQQRDNSFIIFNNYLMINQKINFYHRRIIKDLNEVEKRAENFMSLRLEFINQKCKPLSSKLQILKTRTKQYAQLSQDQKKSFYQSKEIKKISNDIHLFKDMTKFYEQTLDELQKMVFMMEDKNKGLKTQRQDLKRQLKSITRSVILPLIQSTVLPSLQKSQLPPSGLRQRKQRFSLKPRPSISKQFQKQSKDQSTSLLKQSLSDKISNLNTLNYLFKQCFQRKKSTINKMIWHLQSNLVKNKNLFLKVCNILSKESNQNQQLDYDEFRQLNPDELITLIVSFPAVSKSLMQVFQKKRERAAEIISEQSKIK